MLSLEAQLAQSHAQLEQEAQSHTQLELASATKDMALQEAHRQNVAITAAYDNVRDAALHRIQQANSEKKASVIQNTWKDIRHWKSVGSDGSDGGEDGGDDTIDEGEDSLDGGEGGNGGDEGIDRLVQSLSD